MYVVAVHTGMGSMAEAMEPDFLTTVETRDEAKDLEKKIYSSNHIAIRYGELLVFSTNVEIESVGDAWTRFQEECLEEAEDEEDEDED